MATLHTKLSRAFRSERLIYRAPETPDDDEFVFSVNANSDAAISSNIVIPKPPTKSAGQDWIKWLREKAILGVIICLDPEKESSSPKEGSHDTSRIQGEDVLSAKNPIDAGKQPSTPKARPIGIVSIRDPYNGNPHHRQGEIGIDIIEPFQGRGYGTEALRWTLGWGFEMANLHRIRLGVFGWNEKALRIYKRVGFRLESTERESIWCAGAWWDNYWLAMLEHEWREQWKDM